ncbi:hypothetical protein BROUX41_000248 [Berkeleyomyces rouxiae]|uniref:uncharacterized protein n=1 Tax=Berkeleyomyces rouxiae TaxID=2035830 RepID=UPI003B7AC45E
MPVFHALKHLHFTRPKLTQHRFLSIWNLFSTPPPDTTPWQPLFFHPTKRVPFLDNLNLPLEEEFLVGPATAAADYFPVRIGALYHAERYQVVGKLGFGRTSTVWLARDLSAGEYVTLKVFTLRASSPPQSPAAHPQGHGPAPPAALCEAAVLDRLRAVGLADDPSASHLRGARASFLLPRDDMPGAHRVLVQPPMRESWRSADTLMHSVLSRHARTAVRAAATGLVHLHEGAHVVHTDISASNILLGMPRTPAAAMQLCDAFVQAELAQPSARKRLAGAPTRLVYQSRKMLCDPPTHDEAVVADACTDACLSDFGAARILGPAPTSAGAGSKVGFDAIPHTMLTHTAQPNAYRAPEVLLGLPWGFAADVWNLALVAWHMVTGAQLFGARRDRNGAPTTGYSPRTALVDMIAVLGAPPCEMLVGGRHADYFCGIGGKSVRDGDGVGGRRSEKDSGELPQPLAVQETGLKGYEHDAFMEWMQAALRWRPEDRATAHELLELAWLTQTKEE